MHASSHTTYAVGLRTQMDSVKINRVHGSMKPSCKYRFSLTAEYICYVYTLATCTYDTFITAEYSEIAFIVECVRMHVPALRVFK